MKIRRLYIFHGYVQGVGFRYRTRENANMLGLTGWVRNEYDSTVAMEIQGDEGSVDMLISRLQSSPWIDISTIDIKKLPVNNEERYFEIID